MTPRERPAHPAPAHPSAPQGRIGRSLPALLLATATLALAALYATGHVAAYRAILVWMGGDPIIPPFIDTHAVLAALECHRQGIDVFAAMPCDLLGRPHVYGPVWLYLAPLPLGTAHTTAAGALLALLFILGLRALPPARHRRDIAIMSLACLSSMVAFALERGNNDIVIWLIVLAAVRLAQGGFARRGAAYGLIVLASVLKAYPVMLFVLALRETPRRMAMVAAGAGIAILAVVAQDPAVWQRSFGGIPNARYAQAMFGAQNLPYGLADGLAGATATSLGTILYAVLTVFILSLSVRFCAQLDLPYRVSTLDSGETLFLMAGSAMLIGCFFSGPNIMYRGIHFLFVLPALLALSRDQDGRTARLATVAATFIVVLMWSEAIRHLLGAIATTLTGTDATRAPVDRLVWVSGQIMTWWVIGVLGALLLSVSLTTPIGRRLWQRGE